MSGIKRSSLSLDKKAEIIMAVDKAPPSKKKKEIAADFGILPNTLSIILKNRSSILDNQQQQVLNPQRKRLRTAKHPDVEEALLKWFKNARDRNLPISGPLLMTKVRLFAEKLGKKDFEASLGWLTRFKERHGIVFKNVCGESASVSRNVMDQWLSEVFPNLVEGYTPDNIFNADETGLFWRLLPDKTMAFKGDKCHGGKKSKERITLMVGANMDGSEKLPLLAIGKFAKPRCFKGVHSLPVAYEANKKAWMLSELFEQWIRKLDAIFLKKNRQVLLFVDNCPAHPMVRTLKAIKLVFLPPNTTSELQPCDMGIIHSFKMKYRSKILSKYVDAIDSGREASISLLDAFQMAKLAWSEITTETITNYFRKAGFVLSQNEDEEAEETLEETSDEELIGELWRCEGSTFGVSMDDFLAADNDVETTGALSDKDIVDEVQSEFNESTSTGDHDDADKDDCGEEFQRPTVEEAKIAVDNLRRFFYGTEFIEQSTFQKIDDIERALFLAVSKAKKQTSIRDYFTVV